jgi:uncharacterized RDD family membrane protein YckC
MSVIKVQTSFNIDVEFDIPEFYRRLLSLFIDMLIEFFYIRIIFAILSSIARNSNMYDSDTNYNVGALALLMFLPVMIYHVVLEITMNGQSIGKKIMGIRVVNENGGRPAISQFIIRWLLRVSDVWIVGLILILASNPDFTNSVESTFVILAALTFLITDIVLVVSSYKAQRIGDILAHTILIRTNPKMDIEETVFREVEEDYIPSFPQIMQLSDKDINSIKSILETARKKGDFNMAAAASEKIKNHLNINSSLSPFDFLDLLLKDYNYLSVK